MLFSTLGALIYSIFNIITNLNIFKPTRNKAGNLSFNWGFCIRRGMVVAGLLEDFTVHTGGNVVEGSDHLVSYSPHHASF